MERTLPTIDILGTAFFVDVSMKEIKQVNNEQNRISILDMIDKETHYSFEYDIVEKNIPAFIDPRMELISIDIPQLVRLDPKGMEEVYGKTHDEIRGKSDFEIMVDQNALAGRLSGRLTTLDIENHLFYVDLPMNCIKPHDDFINLGIPIEDIEDFFSDSSCKYMIPYNPATHSFEPLDIEHLISIPTQIVIVEFPGIKILDPVGYARKYGLEQRECLRQNPIQKHFKAAKIEWTDTGIGEVIRRNIQKAEQQDTVAGKKKGRSNHI